MAQFRSPMPEKLTLRLASGEPAASSVLPEELLLAADFSSSDARRHFLLGRLAARECLRLLGHENFPLLRVPNERRPLWPSGIIGSIAHTSGQAVCAAGRAADFAAIGVDLETSGRVRLEAAPKLLTPSEFARLENAPNQLALLTSIFAAKEALFKALNPLTGAFFGFQDAEINWDQDLRAGKAVLLRDLSDKFGRNQEFECRGQSEGGLFLAVVVCPK